METNNKNIGKAIAQVRQERKLSRDDIAERALVTVEDMRTIEEGVFSLDQKTLDSIAKVLGVSSQELITRTASPLAVVKKMA